MSAKSAPQVISIKDEYTFRFSGFLMTGLCKSLGNSSFQMIPLTAPPIF